MLPNTNCCISVSNRCGTGWRCTHIQCANDTSRVHGALHSHTRCLRTTTCPSVRPSKVCRQQYHAAGHGTGLPLRSRRAGTCAVPGPGSEQVVVCPGQPQQERAQHFSQHRAWATLAPCTATLRGVPRVRRAEGTAIADSPLHLIPAVSPAFSVPYVRLPRPHITSHHMAQSLRGPMGRGKRYALSSNLAPRLATFVKASMKSTS